MICFSWFQLLRVSELLRLSSSDFDLRNNSLTVQPTKRQPRAVKVPLNTNCSIMFKQLNRSGPLFAHRSQAWCNKQLKLLAANLGTPPYTWHAFRHGAATDLRNQGHSTSAIAALGRWSSNAILNYLH